MAAIYKNIIRAYQDEIDSKVSIDELMDELILRGGLDEGLYSHWYTDVTKKHQSLVDLLHQEDKLYPSLVDVLSDIHSLRDVAARVRRDIDEVRNVVVAGGFPDLPPNYVERTSLNRNVRRSIQKLLPEANNQLVIHGMTGYGKSSLVNQVLQDIIFVKLTKGAMFWISLGQYEDPEHVLIPMRLLYLSAANYARLPVLPQWPENLAEFQIQLKHMFLNQWLRDSLLILDDVRCSEVVRAFDLPCRLICTTQDTKLITREKPNARIISINKGFSESESRELWTRALNTDYLPDAQATRVHQLCDGFPMLVNMIGSFLQASKEEALSNPTVLWDSIVEEVSGSEIPVFLQNDKVICVIKKNVQRLNPTIQHYFHSLAVFPKHANIRPEILIKLWRRNGAPLTKIHLREVMVELGNKSLAVSFYHNDLQTYIYSIHSLIYLYLNEFKKQNQEMIRSYHEKLVKIYDEIDNDDHLQEYYNYILAYYGYHLKHANLHDRFGIYFDLKFIERKIRSVGCADVLRDFEIYKKEITQGKPELENKLVHYKDFLVSYCSHVQCFPDINIVQYALYDNNKNTSVFEEGLKIAGDNQDLLYLKTQPYSGQHKFDTTFRILDNEVVSAVCFANNGDDILLGMCSGNILAKSFNKHSEDYESFKGHQLEIKTLQFSPDHRTFLSVSLDGTARLWRYGLDDDLLSPRIKQRGWQDMHKNNEDRERSICYPILPHNDIITTATFPNGFCDDRKVLAVGTNKGKVELWNGRLKIAGLPPSGIPIACLQFSRDDKEIIVSSGSTIDIYSAKDLMYRHQLPYGNKAKFLWHDKFLKQVISIDQQHVVFHGDETSVKTINSEEEPFDNSITCAGIVNDGRHLVVATNQLIYVFDIQLQKVENTFKNDYGLRILAVTGVNGRILFVGTDNDKVKRHELQLQTEDKPTVRDVALFCCYWRRTTPLYPIVTENNEIHIFKGNLIFSEIGSTPSQVTCVTFSICGNSLLYGCVDGSIYQYNCRNRTAELLINCDSTVNKIKCYPISDAMSVASYNSSDQEVGSVVIAFTSDRKVFFSEESIPWSSVETPKAVVDIFYVYGKIVVVDIGGNVMSIGRVALHDILTSSSDVNTTSCEIHKNAGLLSIASTNGDFFLDIVRINFRDEVVKTACRFMLRSMAKCMTFTPDGRLLATGLADGTIMVHDTENFTETMLQLHQSPVECVSFAPFSEPILVSLSRQVAWWNLRNFLVQSPENCRQFSVLQHLNPWRYKKVRQAVPYLLTSTILREKYLKFISYSPDFKSFLIVDEGGDIYKLDAVI